MSALGQKQTYAAQNGMSALPRKRRQTRHLGMSALGKEPHVRSSRMSSCRKRKKSNKSTTPIWMYFTNAAHPRRSTACVKLRALSSRATGAAAEAVLLAVRSPYPLNPSKRRLLSSASTGQSKMKCLAIRRNRGYLQSSAIGLDNQPANFQPHPHAIGFRREERIKDTVDVVLVYARAGIFDRDLQAIRVEWL